MKLLDLIPLLEDYTRIKRKDWKHFLVKPVRDRDSLILLDLYCIEIKGYTITYGDLLADDWEIIK